MKKSEKAAKDKLRNHPGVFENDMVTRVTRKGTRMEYNEGQAVKQKFGSGLRDIAASLKKKK